MSLIAAALARSKGKPGTLLPPEGSVVPAIHVSIPPLPAAMTDAAVRPAAKRFPWAAFGLGAAVLLISGIGWVMLRPKPAPSPSPRPATLGPCSVATPSPKFAAATMPAGGSQAHAVALPAPPEPTPELQAKVRKLVVTACVAGSQPRIVIGGKVYHPGDFVTAELLLQEIRRDRVILRDAAGGLYEKHF